MLGQRDAGQHDLEPRAGWLVHLAEDQAHLVQEPGLLQFVVQLVPFTNPLADPGEDARPLMSFDDIVDELQGQEALSQCGAAEDARLAAFDQRIQEVDDLDAGLQNQDHRPLVSDRKSTRLNSSHLVISYAVFCLKKKKKKHTSCALVHYKA